MHKILTKVSPVYFIVITSFIGIFFNVVISLIANYYIGSIVSHDNELNTKENLSIGGLFFSITITPLIETFLFQYLPIFVICKRIIERNNVKSYVLAIVFSAFLFGVAHMFFSLAYGILAIIMGLYFGYIAVVSQILRKEKINIFISVYTVHALINASVLILVYFSEDIV